MSLTAEEQLAQAQCAAGLTWRCQPFAALTVSELYALLRLRSEVFVVEQACLFQDMDGLDDACHHLMGLDSTGQLLAYARLVPKGVTFAEASIGRVVTSPLARGSALGHALMAEALARLADLWGVQPVRIGAQAHLQGFYGRHGFVAEGSGYIEDGIPHVEMCRLPKV
ncbi:MAG TPA: GNAT family N-acetyltransferase [Burkholderiaceae bacterium]|nr:GNAT family N-acetyltransferase [Burkholderiaceae bacterium]